MRKLRRIFPMSFGYAKNGLSLAIGIILYVLIGVAAAAFVWIASMIAGIFPALIVSIVGWALGVISTVFGLYVLAGIIILLWAYFKQK